MSRVPRGFLGAVLMAVLLAGYIVLVGVRAIAFLQTGEAVGIAIGIALLVLPVIGAWALVREFAFGVQSQRLVDILAAEEELPAEQLPRRASGRPERDAADAIFPEYRDAVEQHPDDWRAWLRLGLAYDASGDRARARRAIRTAIGLARP